MDDWEKISETSLPVKENFYSQINMEHNTNADGTHAKRVCKDSEIKNLEEYHDLYVIGTRCIWELLKYVPWNI